MIVISIVSGKGGVGKSTIAFELAYLLAEKHRTLAIDLDSQGSLSACFGVTTHSNVALAMAGRASLASLTHPISERLALVPSGIELAATEMALGNQPRREYTLKQALAGVRASYDVALIDSPPALGLLVSNALIASDGVLILAQPEAMNIAAIGAALDAVAFIREHANPTLETIGVLINGYMGHTTHHGEAMATMKAAGLPLLKTAIPRSVRMTEQPSKQRPITQFDTSHGAALAMTNVFQEIQKWLKTKTRK